MDQAKIIETLFKIDGADTFNAMALEIFRFQYENNVVYREFTDHLKINPLKVSFVEEIPFLPVEFFKTHQVLIDGISPRNFFESSSTTGTGISRHYFDQPDLYHRSLIKCFQLFYGNPQNYCILALLPSYLERGRSSLVYMVQQLIDRSGHPENGFYLDERDVLAEKLQQLDREGQKTLVIGVSFALLDLIEKHQLELNNTIVMETGGMKGRRREMVREELHGLLRAGFGVQAIHSEYGMTELFSQAYSKGGGRFNAPPWMKVLIRDINDPLSLLKSGRTGGVNIIDLANLHTCSFLATKDLGRIKPDSSYEILGRYDHSDVRGCNLMIA